MHGDLHHWAGALDGFFDWLHGAVHSDSVYLIVIIAWIETLMAIGAAYMKSMIPLRTMAMLENVFGAAASLGTGSLAGLIKHVVNFPLHDVRLREMRRLIAKVREASNTGMDYRVVKAFYAFARVQGREQSVFERGRGQRGFLDCRRKRRRPRGVGRARARRTFWRDGIVHGRRPANSVCRLHQRRQASFHHL